MNAKKIAEAILASPEQAIEIEDAISVHTLMNVQNFLGVKPEVLFTSCKSERLRISIPVSVPLRNIKMGEKVTV